MTYWSSRARCTFFLMCPMMMTIRSNLIRSMLISISLSHGQARVRGDVAGRRVGEPESCPLRLGQRTRVGLIGALERCLQRSLAPLHLSPFRIHVTVVEVDMDRVSAPFGDTLPMSNAGVRLSNVSARPAPE